MEFTNNQSNAKRVLVPLEPDFSNMSNPSVILEPPNNNWRSNNRQAQTPVSRHMSRRDQSKTKHRSKKRRRRRSSSTSSSSRSILTLAKRAEDQKDQNILIRREKEDIHLLLLLPRLTVTYMTMADTKGLDIVHRLYRIRIFYSLRK